MVITRKPERERQFNAWLPRLERNEVDRDVHVRLMISRVQNTSLILKLTDGQVFYEKFTLPSLYVCMYENFFYDKFFFDMFKRCLLA